jgi:hypothetical protein
MNKKCALKMNVINSIHLDLRIAGYTASIAFLTVSNEDTLHSWPLVVGVLLHVE